MNVPICLLILLGGPGFKNPFTCILEGKRAEDTAVIRLFSWWLASVGLNEAISSSSYPYASEIDVHLFSDAWAARAVPAHRQQDANTLF